MAGNQSPQVLTRSYPLGKKLQVAGVAAACWFATWMAWHGTAPVTRTSLLLAVSIFVSCAAAAVFAAQITVDLDQLQIRSIFGLQRFLRKNLETFESLAAEPDEPPHLLLHFSTGHAFLAPNRGCAHPEEVLAYLQANWAPLPVVARAKRISGVDSVLTMEYEKLHIYVITTIALVMAFIGAIGPYLSGSFIVVAMCIRMLYLSTQRVTTNEDGILVQRSIGGPVHLEWNAIKSVRYWFSPAQGGIALTDGVHTVRLYRCIGNYPRFIAQLQSKVPADRFPSKLQLPLNVKLNEKNKVFWFVMGIAFGCAALMMFEGYYALASWVALGALSSFAVMTASSGRSLHISRDEIRDERNVMFRRAVTTYRRVDLEDLRLGRQLTVGGLWIKFGARRLEITNIESKVPPEELLRLLKREWLLDQRSVQEPETVQRTT